MDQDGILVINKPAGITSHDVVAKLRKVYNMKKIGHTGTLDPMVEGVMVIVFGKATKLAQFMLEESKVYRVKIKLGCATDTEDVTGQVTARTTITRSESELLFTRIQDVCADFIGDYAQIPPMYAAVKIQGKKLYEYARNNESVERTARALRIFSLDYDALSYRYNEAEQSVSFMFDVSGSKGLYVRTLCVDIGQKLGVPATMDQLTRLASGAYTLDEAIDLEKVLTERPAVTPIKDIRLPYPAVYVDEAIATKLRHGYKLPHYFVEGSFAADEAFAVYDTINKELIGIYQQSEKYADKYQSVRVM